MKIYTFSGDDGTTSLSGGKRVPKCSPRVDAYGTVDELIAWIGLLRDIPENALKNETLLYIQDQLMRCAAILATENPASNPKIIMPDSDASNYLERMIDEMEEALPKLNSFILPGGCLASSYCHVARCVCRRAERAVIFLNQAEDIPPIITKFLNRLSDYLFVLARKNSYDSGYQENKWPGR